MKIKFAFFFFLSALCSVLNAQGNIYFVLGSDTGMWDGLDVNNYNCYIKGNLYTDPALNGYSVMNDAFRNSFKDSYGNALKLTWWMMSGNIFDNSINANTPNPVSMAPYLMEKYHGDKIAQFGDELTLHYHTYFWSDYFGNGKYYWNQAKTFNECRPDFNHTLAQNLVDENLFPVSFRSGWHFMDNDWQNYMNQILPYNLDNDYPSKKLIDTTGERDNVIDWSQAPSTWVPYHPSPDNYQIPGNSNGWNVRSKHIGSIQQSEIDSIFARANRGIDQVACLWGHLPETDFLTNLKRVDSLIHKSATKFPNPKFRYCTATEAMQRWLKVTDNKAPLLQVTGREQNGKIFYDITTDEAIFQKQPFVAVKDIYERYTILNCQKTGDNSWQSESTDKAILAKAGFAVTDTSGNLTKKLINYLPNDAFVDNDASASITVNSGTWTKITDHSCFDISYLKSTVDASVGASLTVKAPIAHAGKYNLFVQFAKVDNHADSLFVLISKGNSIIDTAILKGKIDLRSWIYLTTITSNDTTPVDVKISTGGKTESGKIVAFDALKISPLVRDKEIFIRADFADLGDVIVEKETNFTVDITNKGTDPLNVTSISVSGSNTKVNALVPFTIGSLQTYSLPLKVTPGKLGLFTDTLFVASSDPVKPVIKVIVKANSVNYFTIIDNDETANYKESGTWNFSNAKAFGTTSRYASLGQKPGARAVFTKLIEKTGTYDVMQILPETVNASSHVLYIFSVNNLAKDSVYLNQNMNSGSWVKLTTRYIQVGAEAKVEIVDNGGNTVSGAVLRTDAVRFNFISATGVAEQESSLLPKEYALHQNYPNPFNPSTVIAYSLPRTSEVTVKVYDILGHEITTLFNGMQSAGKYSLRFDAQQMGSRALSSGVYFYNLKAVPAGGGETFFSTLKMMYIK